tara:strand:+ start:239 stop:1096 length:858 start_codon:yes stop_codon:yes gene_type:complete
MSSAANDTTAAVSQGASTTANTTKETAKKGYDSTKKFLTSGSPIAQVVIVIIIFILILIVIRIIRSIVTRIQNNKNAKPWLVKGTKECKNQLIVYQNPQTDGSVTLKRSKNEGQGIEFTYVTWIYVNDWAYKYGDWKHIFHKGNPDSWPNRAPGVWFHPKKNTIRVYMNTYNQIADYVDIDNIPLHKWMHLTVMCYGNKLDVFINGFLKKQLILNGIPKQNYGDVYINAFGGYDGFLSEMRYYDYAISMPTLEDIIRSGPSSAPCVDTGARPPYLSPNWWLTYKY